MEYIRVTKQLTPIIETKDDTFWLVNTSAVPVQLALSNKFVRPGSMTDTDVTVGGTVGQVRLDPKRYIYGVIPPEAEADEAIIILSDKKIDLFLTKSINESINALALEVMKLSQRVTDDRMRYNASDLEYTLFLREYFDEKSKNHYQIVTMQRLLTKTASKLMIAESFVQQFRHKFHGLNFTIAKLEKALGKDTDISQLTSEVHALMTTVANINVKLDEILPQLDDVISQQHDLIEKDVTPLKKSITDLRTSLVALNNAFIVMAYKHTEEEIKSAFETLLQTAPPAIIDILGAIKEVLLNIIRNNTTPEPPTTE